MARIVGYSGLGELIPERRPALMIDRLCVADDACSATAVKCVSVDETFFAGHFPGRPIMPGVLQVAAMSQAASALLRLDGVGPDVIPMMKEIERLKFRRPVVPGDLLHVEVARDADDPCRFSGKTTVNGETASQGKLTFALTPREELLRPPAEMAPELCLPEGVSAQNAVLDATEIMNAIPHRYPFLLIDRVLMLDEENLRILGLKNVTGNEWFFKGTPVPVLPGYLQAEMAAQGGCAVALLRLENKDKLVVFASIDKGTFYEPVVPGDQLLIDFSITVRGQFGTAEGKLFVGPRMVANFKLKFAVVDRVV